LRNSSPYLKANFITSILLMGFRPAVLSSDKWATSLGYFVYSKPGRNPNTSTVLLVENLVLREIEVMKFELFVCLKTSTVLLVFIGNQLGI